MPNIELDDFLDGRDRLHIVVVQAVAGVYLEPEARAQARGHLEARELRRLPGAGGLGVGAGMQFDDGRADLHRRFDLTLIRIDEQGNADALRHEDGGRLLQTLPLPRRIEATLGRHFLTSLWHETTV